jgi:hypothetical protein
VATVTISDDVRTLALKVAEALGDPDTWCQGAEARDADGHRVHYDSPDAVRWCAYGHACRINGPPLARGLSCAYWMQFGTDVTADNDGYVTDNDGYVTQDKDNDIEWREYVRDRLLELANS